MLDYLRNEEDRQLCRVLLVETHRRSTFIAVLPVHAKTSLLDTSQRSIQANRNINLWFTGYPAAKHPKQQICHYRHTRKTSELFLLFNTGVDFSLRNNFADSGFCAKVSVPVHIYNSLGYCITILELSCTIFKQIFYSFSSSLSRAERDDFL